MIRRHFLNTITRIVLVFTQPSSRGDSFSNEGGLDPNNTSLGTSLYCQTLVNLSASLAYKKWGHRISAAPSYIAQGAPMAPLRILYLSMLLHCDNRPLTLSQRTKLAMLLAILVRVVQWFTGHVLREAGATEDACVLSTTLYMTQCQKVTYKELF